MTECLQKQIAIKQHKSENIFLFIFFGAISKKKMEIVNRFGIDQSLTNKEIVGFFKDILLYIKATEDEIIALHKFLLTNPRIVPIQIIFKVDKLLLKCDVDDPIFVVERGVTEILLDSFKKIGDIYIHSKDGERDNNGGIMRALAALLVMKHCLEVKRIQQRKKINTVVELLQEFDIDELHFVQKRLNVIKRKKTIN